MLGSSTKTECRRSPLLREREAGVMCSATQCGLRVRRSKADNVDRLGRRSAIGPGKPYWKRPEGSTGAMISLAGRGPAGVGGKGEVGVGTFVDDVAGAVGVGGSFRSGREEKMAAVMAAPDAAEQAAMMANVVFDILAGGSRVLGAKSSESR